MAIRADAYSTFERCDEVAQWRRLKTDPTALTPAQRWKARVYDNADLHDYRLTLTTAPERHLQKAPGCDNRGPGDLSGRTPEETQKRPAIPRGTTEHITPPEQLPLHPPVSAYAKSPRR